MNAVDSIRIVPNLLAFVLMLGACFVLARWISPRLPKGANHALAGMAAAMLAVAVVAFYFAASVGVPTRNATEARRSSPHVSNMDLLPPDTAVPQQKGTASTATSAETITFTESLPEWTRETVSPNNVRKVIASGLFATREEAELQAFDLAGRAAGKTFRHLDPRGAGEMSPLQAELVKAKGVVRRFDEVSERDFGKFKAAMYQTWLQLELTPELGQQLSEAWRTSAVNERLQLLGQVAAVLTAAAAAATLALRLDSARAARQRVTS